MSGIKASILRAFLEVLFLPTKAYVTICSSIKAIYRMCVSKQNLLEWMTSEEAEKQSKTDIVSHFRFMWANVIMGIVFAGIAIVGAYIYARIRSSAQLCAPTDIRVYIGSAMVISSNLCMAYE